MSNQLGSETKIGKIMDLAPVSPELKTRMAGLYDTSLAGASQGMPSEEQNRNLNLAKNWASQPIDVRTDEDIETQQAKQKSTGYVA